MQNTINLHNQTNLEQSEMSKTHSDNTMPQESTVNETSSHHMIPMDDSMSSSSPTTDVPLPLSLYGLSDEIIDKILLHVEYTPELHRALLTTDKRMHKLASDPMFCRKVAETRFPEVYAILDLSAPTPMQLMSCYHYNKQVDTATDLVCSYLAATAGGVRRDIIKQGIFILDAGQIKAKEYLRLFLAWRATIADQDPSLGKTCAANVYYRNQKRVWSGFDTEYTARVLRYTLRILLNYFMYDIYDIFDIEVWTPGSRKCEMVQAAFERACICTDVNEYGSLAANIIRSSEVGYWSGDGVKLPIIRTELRAGLDGSFQSLEAIFDNCSADPTLWTERETLVWSPFSEFTMLTDRIVGDGEGPNSFYHRDALMLDTWSTADFERFFDTICTRQQRCVKEVFETFAGGAEAQPIDWRSIGRALMM